MRAMIRSAAHIPSMSNEKRVRSGVPAGGEFTKHDHTESAVSLSDEYATARSQIVASMMSRGGYSIEAATATAEHHLSAPVDVPPAVIADYFEYRQKLTDTARHALPADQELHAHLWTVPEILEMRSLVATGWASEYAFASLLKSGVKPDRVRELLALSVPNNPTSLAAMSELNNIAVSEWMQSARGDAKMSQWLGQGGWPLIPELHHAGINPETAALYAELGVTPRQVIDHSAILDRHVVADFKTASGFPGDRAAKFIIHNTTAENPVTAEDAKPFGPSIDAPDVAHYVTHGVDAKAARSLLAADRSMYATEATTLFKAGVITGKEFKAWRELTARVAGSAVGTGRSSDVNTFSIREANPIARIVVAKSSGVPVGAAATFVRSGVREPTDWKILTAAGVTDTGPWVKAISGEGNRANQIAAPGRGALGVAVDGIAGFAAAGGTPAELRRTLRAGIPIDQAATHVGSPDLWAAGAESRAAVMAKEQADVENPRSFRNRKVEPWGFTEANYADDPEETSPRT